MYQDGKLVDDIEYDKRLMKYSQKIPMFLGKADYLNNNDPAMEAVKDYNRIVNLVNKSILEMEQAYTDNGIPKLKETYSLIKQKLLESGYNLEKFFADFYDRFLTETNKSTADLVEYLAFAVSECPESIDLCYSLAVQLESEGRLNEAKTIYNRCLKLNPAHHYSKMKLDLIGLKENQ